jgi:DNA-binding transcriptional LysR family regulator
VPRSKIELRHVRYIIAAAESGSFRRAAQDLGVEQSAISRRIRDVEDEIGAQLFRRHPAGVDLTDIGKQFLNQAAPGARQIGSALDGARTVANRGRYLRIGVFGPLTMGFLSELFGAFRGDRPGVKLRFSEGSCSELIAAVRRGQLDVGIVAEAMPGKGFDVTHLWAEPVYVAISDGDPLADQKAVFARYAKRAASVNVSICDTCGEVDLTTFRDALAPLAARLVREHHVLHIAADLPGDEGAIDRARTEILKWAQKRSGGQLPRDAMAGRGFELLAAGRNCSAVEVDLPEIHAWALRQEDPDKTVAGRIWTSEAILWRTPDEPPRFAARLIVGSGEAELDIAPAAPGYIRQLVDTVGLTSGGRTLSSVPWFIGDQLAEESFLDLLATPARRLPVVVVSVMDRTNPEWTIDVDKLAAGLCGLADVVAILPETSWALTERFGKRLSVFDRAVRIYMPGFDEAADPFSHPLWLGTRLTTVDDAALVDRQIRARVAQYSTRAVRLGDDILPFAQLRSYARKAEQDRLATSGANDSEKLSAAENRIAALAKELSEAKDLEQYALEEERSARLRAEEAERREHNATAQIQLLLKRLSDAGVVDDESQGLPVKWSEFEDWCDLTLVGRVALTGAARRGCKKALYSDVEQVARCLLWLANECRRRLLEGGGSLRDKAVEDGIRNSPCGSDEFKFDWQGRRLSADWHVKTGGNTRAPESCLRIYYGWDDQTQQVVVADMPAHRKSGAS